MKMELKLDEMQGANINDPHKREEQRRCEGRIDLVANRRAFTAQLTLNTKDLTLNGAEDFDDITSKTLILRTYEMRRLGKALLSAAEYMEER